METFFNVTFPNFLKAIDPYCANDGFLVGNSLTTADFWIGGIYVNYVTNPNVGYGKTEWAATVE